MIGFFPRLLLVCLLGLPWQSAVAEPLGIVGILVMRNGNVLAGHVIRLQDHYRVEIPNGCLQVPVDQVEMFCRNLDEAYERRRRVRAGSTADSHLELVRWCLKHRLYEHASRELLDARAIDPEHRKLAMLERRLQYVQQLDDRKKSPTPATDPATAQLQDDTKPARRTPQRARALFVRQIQPLLVRSCAASGCHQSGSSRQFQLNRLAVVGAGHPHATLSNLASTLAQIDWQEPEESVLLGLASTPHGTGSSHPLQPYQLQILQKWVVQLARSSQAADLADAYVELAEKRSQEVRTASAQIKDPFDPEVFNRRTRRQAKPKSGPASTNEQADPSTDLLPSTPLQSADP